MEWLTGGVDRFIKLCSHIRMGDCECPEGLSIHVTRRAIISDISSSTFREPSDEHRPSQFLRHTPGFAPILGGHEAEIELAGRIRTIRLFVRVEGDRDMGSLAAGIGVNRHSRRKWSTALVTDRLNPCGRAQVTVTGRAENEIIRWTSGTGCNGARRHGHCPRHRCPMSWRPCGNRKHHAPEAPPNCHGAFQLEPPSVNDRRDTERTGEISPAALSPWGRQPW